MLKSSHIHVDVGGMLVEKHEAVGWPVPFHLLYCYTCYTNTHSRLSGAAGRKPWVTWLQSQRSTSAFAFTFSLLADNFQTMGQRFSFPDISSPLLENLFHTYPWYTIPLNI